MSVVETDMLNPLKSSLLRGLALPAILAGFLGGCALTTPDPLENAYVPFSGSEKFPIEMASGPVTLAVPASRGGLQPAQVNTVAGFARQALGNATSTITVRRPSSGGQATARSIVDVMTAQGISRSRIKLATYPGPASAPVEVSYVRTYARTAPCGDWSRDLNSTWKNETAPNHGCALHSNIAAMIVNPENVVTPAPVSTAPAASRMSGIQRVMDVTSMVSTSAPSAGGTP